MELIVNPKLRKAELVKLFKAVGKKTDKIDALRAGFKKSYVLAAYEGDELIGFVQTVSDYATVAYIQEMIVLPAYWDTRIGETLIEHVVSYFGALGKIYAIAPEKSPEVDRFFRFLSFNKIENHGYSAYLTGQDN